MKIGVFVPIGNNGWLISTHAPQYMPTFELNKAIVQKAEHYHFDFALSMIKLRGFGGKTEFSHLALVQDKAVVVSGSVLYLGAVCVYSFPYSVRSAEIEGCALNFQNLSGGNGIFVNGNKEIGIDLTNNVHCRWGGVGYTCQGEEAVACHVHNGLLVGCSAIVDNQFVVFCERILDGHLQFAGESFFVIG